MRLRSDTHRSASCRARAQLHKECGEFFVPIYFFLKPKRLVSCVRGKTDSGLQMSMPALSLLVQTCST